MAHDLVAGLRVGRENHVVDGSVALVPNFEQVRSTMQQANIGLDPDAPQVDINADSGGIQARRINDRLYQDEQATMHAAKTAAE